ncbi:hypothetical protein RQP46_000667 [Phenoliferia psychrophenolica]
MTASPDSPAPHFPPFECAGLLSAEDHGDWRDELTKDGFYVVKEAIPREEALDLRDQAHHWLESFGLGYQRGDVSTFVREKLPVDMKGGMLHGYGIAHESWIWSTRLAPGVVSAFSKVWGTDELITSFDGACIMLPHRTDVTGDGKWQHIDQSPARNGFYCLQGIVNLGENGPSDGGLMVLKGSSLLMEKYFDAIGRSDLASRTWDVCMAPARFLSEEDRATRAEAFAAHRGTTHVPFASIFSRPHEPKIRHETGLPDPLDTDIPKNPVVPTKRVLQLVGIEAY